jgi:CDGSH-type Zn-finger protein
MAATKITVSNDGPLVVEGDFELLDQEAKSFGLGGRTRLSLCRCGHSERKPFCDGSHKRTAFQNAVQAHDLPPPKPKA